MSALCNLDGGLWPVTWAVLIVCVTIYFLKKPGASDND